MFDMIGNIVKNLFSKPATRNYPFVVREVPVNARGHISGIDPEACIYCGICQRKCPSDAIVVDKVNRTWEIETYRCIVCSECVTVCPKQCIYMDAKHLTSSTKQDRILCKGSPKPEKVAAPKAETPKPETPVEESVPANA
ncbi:MAG: 4Fe-4S binding protein [Clostridia bacterium]